jgi:glutamate---methylamine ligase
MVRIPEPGRFELRLMDGAANPYLLQAGLLVGGLDGIARKRDPGKRLDVNTYELASAPAGVPRQPLNLLDSLRAFASSAVLREALGVSFVGSVLSCVCSNGTTTCGI